VRWRWAGRQCYVAHAVSESIKCAVYRVVAALEEPGFGQQAADTY
jgi:hypothetical protein